MDCKNCGNTLRTDFTYCPNCGAKIIKNRLSLKNVWQDLSYQVLNLDNTFLKTFRHLFSRPADVVNTYIKGTRKKYMNPISYFAIAITLSGILFFVLKKIYKINLMHNSFTEKQASNLDFIMDYQGLLSYFIMPIYALMTWLLFIDKKKLNYTEHLVANAYITGQTSFVQVLICLPLFGFFDIGYDIFNWAFLIGIVIYQFFVFGQIHQTSFLSTFVRGLIYLILFAFVMLALGMAILLIATLTGQISLESIVPK
ncbi:DUF3667 domain-containing protein [Flagellimonas eckloniae]|uniref:Zinc-ribbon domain-containing protein n=1 Tax=Flagellimonas eckloniae TaxID=346185 RepID=A0A0Q1DRA5_9FLAO|nr:DUF3667 domain-containing protein [Allomuricauda eckloniae]KQC31394.1 hypothetical protein AAY42_17010 [Allomuricauda eckloniae]